MESLKPPPRLMESLQPPPPPPKREKSPVRFRTARVTQKPKSIQKKRIEEPVAEEPVALDSSPSIFVKK